MLNVTRLLTGMTQPADTLRYGHGPGAPRAASSRRPVVVWNITRRCNLRCIHCYSNSEARSYPGELTLAECLEVIDDLAAFRIPALLLSGGEPTLHPHFFSIAEHARRAGLKVTLSTNGTRLTRDSIRRLRSLGLSYIGISLDGIGPVHDQFRGCSGAFEQAVRAIRTCQEEGQKVGLRLTLTRHNVRELGALLDFIERENIPRVCFYHLVYSGRGHAVEDLPPAEVRQALDQIFGRVLRWADLGHNREVLTVDQPADGAYLTMFLDRIDPARAEEARRLLRWNGGGAHSSGVGIGNIDHQGRVHPDQFWHEHTLGNVRERPFSQIWTESEHPILLGLRNRRPLLRGRCATCRFQELCGGGFRVRALQRTGDPWAEDPGCYLTDDEIAPR
ncbi:MAG: putative heme d1 biosynthesis radical SAM protein NirJ1 [Candidatus Methylacidiphilales bacterium]